MRRISFWNCVPGEDQWYHLCTWRRSVVPPMYLKKISGATYVPGEGQWCHLCTWRRSGPAAAQCPCSRLSSKNAYFPSKTSREDQSVGPPIYCTWRRSVVPPMYLEKVTGATYVPEEDPLCHLCTWRRSVVPHMYLEKVRSSCCPCSRLSSKNTYFPNKTSRDNKR